MSLPSQARAHPSFNAAQNENTNRDRMPANVAFVIRNDQKLQDLTKNAKKAEIKGNFKEAAAFWGRLLNRQSTLNGMTWFVKRQMACLEKAGVL